MPLMWKVSSHAFIEYYNMRRLLICPATVYKKKKHPEKPCQKFYKLAYMSILNSMTLKFKMKFLKVVFK